MASPASVTWDVADITKDLIDNNWDTNNADKPQYIELRTEDSDGDTRKTVRRHNEYILFAEEGERGTEYSDIFWNTRDLTAGCYAELSTAESRARRNELFGEVERITVDSRTRNSTIGTPGGWDVLQMNANFIDDENYGWWVAEIHFMYTKRKDSV